MLPCEPLEPRRLLSSTYCVSPSGSDAAAGTAAHPFRTIQRAADVARAGDTVDLLAGTYRESVRPAASGTAGRPITFQAVGTVTVTSGLDPVALTAHAPPVAAAGVAGLGGDLWRVSGPGLYAGLAGRVIHLGAGQRWLYTAETILASGSGWAVFRLAPHTKYEVPAAGNRYFVTGQNPPEVPAAWDLRGRSYIALRGIGLYAATITTDSHSAGVVLDHLNAEWVSTLTGQSDPWDQSGAGGIRLAGPGDAITDSTIAHSGGNGIVVTGRGCVVAGNTVSDCDRSWGDEAGVQVYAAGAVVVGNTVSDCARDGIKASGSTGIRIAGNVVHDVMLQTTDGGGIYTYGTDGAGSRVSGNRVYSVRSGGYGAAGIYLDNGSAGWRVDGNDVRDCTIGFKCNPPSTGNLIGWNTIAGCDQPFAGALGADWLLANVINS